MSSGCVLFLRPPSPWGASHRTHSRTTFTLARPPSPAKGAAALLKAQYLLESWGLVSTTLGISLFSVPLQSERDSAPSQNFKFAFRQHVLPLFDQRDRPSGWNTGAPYCALSSECEALASYMSK